jgi:DNA-directed RNA polymerase specialized sigma24 family protein
VPEFEKKIEKILDMSYHYCLKKCQNQDLAEEISMKVAGIYCIKHKEIKDDTAWVIGTIHHKLTDHYRSEFKQKKIKEQIMDKEKLLKIHNNESLKEFDRVFDQIQNLLANEELNLMLDYYNKQIPISELASSMNTTEIALRKRIHNLNEKVKVLQKLDNGYRFGSDLVLPLLNRKIFAFLKSLVDAINSNSLDSLRNYLAELPKEKYNLLMKIKEIKGFEFEICNENSYNIIIASNTIDDKPYGLEIGFYIRGKGLRVTDIRDIFKSATIVTDIEDQNQIKDMFVERNRNEDGTYNIDIEAISKITKRYSD